MNFRRIITLCQIYRNVLGYNERYRLQTKQKNIPSYEQVHWDKDSVLMQEPSLEILQENPNESGNYSREDKRKLKKKIKRKEKEKEQAALLSKMMFDENNPLGIGSKLNQGSYQYLQMLQDESGPIVQKPPTYLSNMIQSDFSPLMFGLHPNPSLLEKPVNVLNEQQNGQLLSGEQEIKQIINNNSRIQPLDSLQEKVVSQSDQQYKDYHPIQSPFLNYQQDAPKCEIKDEFEMFRKMSLENFGYSIKLQEEPEDLFLQNYINQ